jgi:glucose/mannose-6-phosphate isomerase
VLGVLSKLGFARDLTDDIEAALSDLAKLEERVHEGARTNDAKKMALDLGGRIPFAYGAGVMGVMARRVKGQWNENAKNWSAFDVMSELNHNAVVGFEHPPIAKEALTVLLLRSDRDNPRHKLRFEVTRELLDRARIPHKTLQFAGRNMLSEVLQMVYFSDYVSFYVALLNGADPTPVKSIDYLKDRLAKGS